MLVLYGTNGSGSAAAEAALDKQRAAANQGDTHLQAKLAVGRFFVERLLPETALLLARTAEREHEISIRYSLGASRAAIVSQILAEVFGLAMMGSLAGLLVAGAAASAFHRLAGTLPRAEEITLNWKVAAYSLLAGALTTLLCGLLPALRGTRRALARSPEVASLLAAKRWLRRRDGWAKVA